LTDEIPVSALVEAMIEEDGDVTLAAKRLGVESGWLRRKALSTPELEEAVEEIKERLVDKAVRIMRKGMESENYMVQFYAGKEFLRSETARKRGFGQVPQAQVIESGGNARTVIVLKWQGDDDVKQIEGTTEK
jgi:hypothetical protein